MLCLSEKTSCVLGTRFYPTVRGNKSVLSRALIASNFRPCLPTQKAAYLRGLQYYIFINEIYITTRAVVNSHIFVVLELYTALIAAFNIIAGPNKLLDIYNTT